MGELMTKHMWDQRHKEVVADTKKYVVQIVGRYKAAYSYCVLKKLRKNLSASNEQVPLLEQRRWQNYNRPLHCGSVYIHNGLDQKKWRRRYCVLQPDYTLEVYDSLEDFEAANRPRYSRKHSNYEVIDNIDIHINQVVKAYMRDFGFVCDNVTNVVKRVSNSVDASKRPTQHVLALYHPFRGFFYIAADSAVEKDQWLKSLQDAQRQLSGVHCDDETQREAFEFAISEACAAEEHCNVTVKMSGTQEEITANFIVDYLSNGCKTMLQTKVKGDMYKKFKMWESISSFLLLSVQKIVESDYPPLRAKAEAEVEEAKQKIFSSMPQINSVYETASAEIIAGLETSFREELATQILPKIPDMVTRMGESMITPLREVKDIFVSLSESVKRQVTSTSTEFANNVDCFFLSNLDVAPRSPEVMHSTFQAAMGKKSAFIVLEETFPKAQYSVQEAKFCVLLQKLLDSAICTFEVLCGDYVLKNGGHLQAPAVAKIETRVLKKLSHDNVILLRQFLTETTQDIVFQLLRSHIYYDSRNKLRNYEDFIPADLAQYMSIAFVFRDSVYEKLDNELRPVITAAFKRLSHDRFSMIRYHSSSTINSHSSTASDELSSSTKHESSVSRTSSIQIPPEQYSAGASAVVGAVEVEPAGTSEQNNATLEGRQELGDGDGTNSQSCTPPEGFVQDGETGECLGKVDENGEVIRTADVPEDQKEEVPKTEETVQSRDPTGEDDAVPSKIPCDRMPAEGTETNPTVEEAEDCVTPKLHDNLPEEDHANTVDNPPESDISDTQHIVEPSGDADEEEEEAQRKPESEGENPVGDSLQLNPNVPADPEYGEETHREDTTKDEPVENEERVESPEENRENGTQIQQDLDPKVQPAILKQEESPKIEEGDTQDEDVTEESVSVGQIELPQGDSPKSHEEDVVIDKNPEEGMTNGHLEDAKNSSSGEEEPVISEKESLQDEPADSQVGSSKDHESQVTSFSKEVEEESSPVHANGNLNQNGLSGPVQGEEIPAVPTRKKKRGSSKSNDREAGKTTNDNNPTQQRALRADLEKYNGVVEQIIQTGEEKLI